MHNIITVENCDMLIKFAVCLVQLEMAWFGFPVGWVRKKFSDGWPRKPQREVTTWLSLSQQTMAWDGMGKTLSLQNISGCLEDRPRAPPCPTGPESTRNRIVHQTCGDVGHGIPWYTHHPRWRWPWAWSQMSCRSAMGRTVLGEEDVKNG